MGSYVQPEEVRLTGYNIHRRIKDDEKAMLGHVFRQELLLQVEMTRKGE